MDRMARGMLDNFKDLNKYRPQNITTYCFNINEHQT